MEVVSPSRRRRIAPARPGAERLRFIQPGTDPRISYSYNTDGSLSGYTDAAGATTYAYTPSGQVQSVTYLYTGQPAQELDYTYFPDGSRQPLVWKSGGAQVASWTYGYDLAGRLSSVSNSFGETTGWSYDGEGKLTGQTNQNGTALSIGYVQQRGWPTELVYRAGQSTLADYLVEYDGGIASVGLMTGYTDQTSRAQFGFGYDALYRLMGESYTNPGAGGEQYNFTYSYDLAGNRTATTVDGNWTYTVDAANKYTAVYTGQGGGGGIPAWTWDADGNCTNPMGELAFGWNALSEMTSATVLDPNTGQPTGVAYQFAWDGEGRMVAQTGTGVPARIHVYDGDLLLGEVDASGAPVAAYTWGADGLVSERLLSGTPKSLWYVFGPTGDTKYLLDAGGTVVDAYTFDAFGQRRATPNFGTDANPFGYKGQFGYYAYAPSSAFLLCGARFYYPFWGRWLSRDPIGYEGGPNLYEYCDGDPVGELDPDGTFPDGPGGTRYRIDIGEGGGPDMHIYHRGGETNITEFGGWRRGIHHGEKMVPLPKSLRAAYRPIIRNFLRQCRRARAGRAVRGAGRVLLIGGILLTAADVAEAKPADRPKVIRDEGVDLVVGAIGSYVGAGLGTAVAPGTGTAAGRTLGGPAAIWLYHNGGGAAYDNPRDTSRRFRSRYGVDLYDDDAVWNR